MHLAGVLGPPVDLVHQQPGVAPLCNRDNALQLLSNACRMHYYEYMHGLDIILAAMNHSSLSKLLCSRKTALCIPQGDRIAVASDHCSITCGVSTVPTGLLVLVMAMSLVAGVARRSRASRSGRHPPSGSSGKPSTRAPAFNAQPHTWKDQGLGLGTESRCLGTVGSQYGYSVSCPNAAWSAGGPGMNTSGCTGGGPANVKSSMPWGAIADWLVTCRYAGSMTTTWSPGCTSAAMMSWLACETTPVHDVLLSDLPQHTVCGGLQRL